MALINYKNEPEKKPLPAPSVHEPINFKSTVVDTEYVPRSNIITQISGAPWKVDYYSQVITTDNAVMGHNPSKDALTQSYTKIVDFILRVSSPLSTSQDTKTNQMLVVGTASIYPQMYPNQGDMFVANIGDGRRAIFKIINLDEKSIFKDTSWTVDYQLVAYADGEPGSTRFRDLESKVIDTKYFVMDYMDYNQNPLLTTEEYGIYKNLRTAYHEIVDNYYRLFASKRLKLLLVPGQKNITYDPFLVRFMVRAFDGNVTPRASLIRVLNVSDHPAMCLPTIWEALFDRDTDIMNYITTMMYLTPITSFTPDPVYEGIYYSGAKDVVYPGNPILDIDTQLAMGCKCHCVPPSSVRFNASKDTLSITNFRGTPLIYKTNKDGYYVFSKDFYQRTNGMSLLEAQVWNYLEGKPVDECVINELVKDYHNWGSLEKFYYVPVLLLLIQSIIHAL